MHPTLGHQPRAARSHVWRVRVPRLACSHLHDVWPSNSFQFNEIRPWKIRCFKILDNGEQIIQLKAFVCWTQTCKCRCWNASCLQLSPSFHSHDWNKGTIKNYVETKRKETVTFFSFFWTTSCSSKKMLAVTWHVSVSEMFRRFLLCFVLKPVKVNGRGISKPLLEMDSVTLRPFQTNGPPTRPWIMTLHSVVWLGSYILCHCCRSLRANLETNHLQSQWVL